MKLISIGHKMPSWVAEGFYDYQKRFIKPWSLELIECSTDAKALEKIAPQDFCITLDVLGKSLSTENLSHHLAEWQALSKPLVFLIGGADGLTTTMRKRANFAWSLSALTFPHQLVKVIVAEQLYRAVMILQGHPYHRI